MSAHRFDKLVVNSLVVVFILAAGCAKQETGKALSVAPATNDKSKTSATGLPGTNASKPDLAVSAVEFVKDMQDLTSAEKKYRGKLIEVTGVVSGFDWLEPMKSRALAPAEEVPNPLARSVISLKTDLYVLPRLDCLGPDDEPWARVSRGQQVKVQGKWHPPGSSEFPALADCVIVEAGAFTTPVVTAPELAKAFAADRKAFKEKFQGSPIIVVGKIKKVTRLFAGPTMISLETNGADHLVCQSDSKLFDPLQSGQNVKIYGYLDRRQADDARGASFIMCLTVRKPIPEK